MIKGGTTCLREVAVGKEGKEAWVEGVGWRRGVEAGVEAWGGVVGGGLGRRQGRKALGAQAAVWTTVITLH